MAIKEVPIKTKNLRCHRFLGDKRSVAKLSLRSELTTGNSKPTTELITNESLRRKHRQQLPLRLRSWLDADVRNG